VLLVGALLLAAAPAAGEGKPPAPERLEPGLMPILAGDSDIGIGFGAVGTLARFRPGCRPYCWRLEALVYLTVKPTDAGVQLPYHDYYLKLDLPGLAGGRLRLYGELGFSRYTTSGYYGLGDASPALDDRPSRGHQYDRIFPQLRARARIALLRHLSLMLGASFTYNRLTLYEGSKLAEDLAAGDVETRSRLHGTSDHALGELTLGWIWDTRDHERAPTRGMFHELSWRGSPALAAGADVAYGGLNLTLRFFQALWRERLVLAARVMADLLLGDPPFYELACHGGLFPSSAIGGATAVRGVPLQRYHGKVKLLGNLELRARLLPFRIRSQRFNLGALLFVDAGRVWTDYRALALDGAGAGIKVGLGGGLRLQWGETFILRADVAWSPDARPVGVYVDVGHIF